MVAFFSVFIFMFKGRTATFAGLVNRLTSLAAPKPAWGWAIMAGTAYGMVAFFSVFIFMFKGRTATFAGLVNRLTSLVAGTTATLVSAILFGGAFPKTQDWVSLGFIFVAVGFLSRAERKRMTELALSKEIEAVPFGKGLAPAAQST